MIRQIDLRGDSFPTTDAQMRGSLPRAAFDVDAAQADVVPICEAVRTGGAPAIREITERFDGPCTSLRVPTEILAAAAHQLDPLVTEALKESIRRARIVHNDQRRQDVHTQVAPGAEVIERWVPVERVGLYVPGGLAVYPSSVVMNVVPAQVASVPSLAIASPPQRENTGIFAGYPHPTILAAARILGVEEVYAVGGAQAVAMFAYGAVETDGTPVCAPVTMVTGPGNIYVAAAKRLLKGIIGIDSEAGPTEIAILADNSANASHVAADLISQAEHDELAASVLITDSSDLAEKVVAELPLQIAATRHKERITVALSSQQSAVVLVDDMNAGLQVANAYAAEHLEIHAVNEQELATGVVNAGAVFVGTYTPVSLGDYSAGSNHVLPTGGTARHSSGLSVQSFLRGIHQVHYTQAAMDEIAAGVIALAESEHLPAHGAAVAMRQESS